MDGVYPENDQNVVTSGGSGFGIMAVLAGIHRGYVTREEGLARMERIVSFLETADRFHGAYPHWWYGDTGRVKPFGQKDNGGDLVETAFIMQALLAVHQYYAGGHPQDKALAATIAPLLARRHELEPFARFHMQGHWDPDGSEMSQAIQRVVAHYGGRAAVKSFPWWLVKLAAPFNATLREMVEMHYLWRLPVRLRNDKLVDFLGAEPHTPLDSAVYQTLQGLGCLPAGAINQEAGEA